MSKPLPKRKMMVVVLSVLILMNVKMIAVRPFRMWTGYC